MAVRQRDGDDLRTLWGPTEVRNFRTGEVWGLPGPPKSAEMNHGAAQGNGDFLKRKKTENPFTSRK